MASGPITSWQIHGETMERVIDFIFFGRKAMTNLHSVLKSRDITLPTKVHIVKAMVFPVVMYGYESQTGKRLSTEELIPLNCGAGGDF